VKAQVLSKDKQISQPHEKEVLKYTPSEATSDKQSDKTSV